MADKIVMSKANTLRIVAVVVLDSNGNESGDKEYIIVDEDGFYVGGLYCSLNQALESLKYFEAEQQKQHQSLF